MFKFIIFKTPLISLAEECACGVVYSRRGRPTVPVAWCLTIRAQVYRNMFVN